jgi:hypothetical protein
MAKHGNGGHKKITAVLVSFGVIKTTMTIRLNRDLNLGDILVDSDVEPSEHESSASEFDPSFLLSEPILHDMILSPEQRQQRRLLQVPPGIAPPLTDSPQNMNFGQSSFQQQEQLRSQQNFNSYNQNAFTNKNQMPQNKLQKNSTEFVSLNDSDVQIHETQQAVKMRMRQLQQQIQQVQQQIQHVQLQSSQLEIQSSHVDQQQKTINQQQTILGGMLNSNVRPSPSRSNSAPIMQRPNNTMSNNFMQPQNSPSLAAMAASLQGRSPQMDDSGHSFKQAINSSFNSTGQASSGSVNEAMEKLCESMRRSAMSRSLVKQLSGRTAPAVRDLGRSRSNGGLTRGNLNRNHSGKNIQRTHSGSDTLRPGPIRKPSHDSKHRIQRDALSSSGGAPGRGVFRNKSSQGSLGGTTRLQIDDNSLGLF